MGLLTIQDMHRQIDQEVQTLGVFAYANRESEEIDIQINTQIYRFIDKVIDFKVKGNKIDLEGFQSDQVTLDNLRTIHIIEEALTITSSTDYVSAPLPNEYYHYVKAKATVSYKCYENKVEVTKTDNVKVRIMNSQDFDIYEKDTFHKTSIESPLGRIVGDKLYVYFDSNFSITGLKLDYIKKPNKVKYNKDGNGDYQASGSVDCNLPDNTHYIITGMASQKIMKIIESSQQKIVNFEQE